jgi:hypothetical protein
MGLKGYRLWVVGQLDSTCRAPPRDGERDAHRSRAAGHGVHLNQRPVPLPLLPDVALQVAIRKANFETGFST